MLVTNDRMEQWGASEEDLHSSAMEGAWRNEPPVLLGMDGVLNSILLDDKRETNLFEEKGTHDGSGKGALYVLTNKSRINGASVAAYPEVMERLDGMFPKGFYLLPSSVHEMLVCPRVTEFSPRELGEMVRAVNRECLAREDFLSDRVYEYDREAKTIRQIPESMEREKEAER